MAENLRLPPNLAVATPQPVLNQWDLPLNLVAIIISHMDDLGDLARLTCTCRLMYYMTLPKLWERVMLRSYDEIRYQDGRPEGFGSGSPFAMGLNALVAGSVAGYVRSLTLTGEWKELDMEDYSRGRVPDNAMMLNITLRAALDKMPNLETFKWELNPKLSQTVYQGLAARPKLTFLSLRFPSKRIARPTVQIPPIPSLRKFIGYDLDPLAYPDDISLLLLHCKKLEDLTLHWNPRIRRDAEQSVNLGAYFARCAAANHSLKLKHFGLFNMFASATGTDFDSVFDMSSLHSITIINMRSVGDSTTVFLDDTWRLKIHKPPPHGMSLVKKYRGDILDKQHVQVIATTSGMEEIYFINTHRYMKQPSSNGTPSTPNSIDPGTPKVRNYSPYDIISVASDYLAAIHTAHGRTMRFLLLSDQWPTDPIVIKKLVQNCPNLEQLGVALSDNSPEAGRVFMPFAPNLTALRLLIKPTSELQEKLWGADPEMLELLVAYEFWRPEYRNLKYLGMGCHVFKLGGIGKHPDGSGRLLRNAETISFDDVKHIEIWGQDTADII